MKDCLRNQYAKGRYNPEYDNHNQRPDHKLRIYEVLILEVVVDDEVQVRTMGMCTKAEEGVDSLPSMLEGEEMEPSDGL